MTGSREDLGRLEGGFGTGQLTRGVPGENVEVWRWWAVAVTFTEIRWPRSQCRTRYDVPVAPAIGWPAAYHWRCRLTCDGDQRPAFAVSRLPSVGVRWMRGAFRGTGPRPHV